MGAAVSVSAPSTEQPPADVRRDRDHKDARYNRRGNAAYRRQRAAYNRDRRAECAATPTVRRVTPSGQRPPLVPLTQHRPAPMSAPQSTPSSQPVHKPLPPPVHTPLPPPVPNADALGVALRMMMEASPAFKSKLIGLLVDGALAAAGKY